MSNRLTEFGLNVTRRVAGMGPARPSADGEDWVYQHWSEEFSLSVAWLVLSALLLAAPLGGALLGEWIDGSAGYRFLGLIGMGITAFGASGMLLHMGRLLVLRAYFALSARTLVMPAPMVKVSPPDLTVKRLLTSTDRDALFQLVCGALLTIVLLMVTPQ